MSIGQRIKKARVALKLSQAALGQRVGMTQASISELESGESEGTGKIASFAAALGVSALYLETGKGLERPALSREHSDLAHAVELLTLFMKSSDLGRATILDAARFADKG